MEGNITYKEIVEKIDNLVKSIDDLINEIEQLGDFGQMIATSNLEGKLFERTMRLSKLQDSAYGRLAKKGFIEPDETEVANERKAETTNSTDK